MTVEELQRYVESHIPIVKANHFTITDAKDGNVIVEAPLAEHVNHRGSAFGGSLSTALILVAWARIRLWTDDFDPQAVIVISEQNVRFRLPVLADFEAHTKPIAPEVLAKAQAQLARFGKARFTVEAEVVHRTETVARAEFWGEFVVVSSSPHP